MARTPSDVTDAELAVLRVLWERGASTRRQIADLLYPGGAASHFTTVQKLLERLEEKRHVRRAWQGPTLTFEAILDRQGLITRRLREVADKLCDGSLTPLLMNLVREKGLTPDELDELQALVQALRRQAGEEEGR